MIEIWATQALINAFSRLWMAKHRGYMRCTSTLQRRPCGDGWMDGGLKDDFMIGYMAVGWLVGWFGGSDWGQVLPRKFALKVGDEKSSSFC